MFRFIACSLICVFAVSVGCWKKNNAKVPEGRPKSKQQSGTGDAIDQALAGQGYSGRDGQSNQQAGSGSGQGASKQFAMPAMDWSKPIKGLEDVPPAPAGFTGEDQPADAKIPVENQRRLRNDEDGWVEDIIPLVTYPHPKVRYQAIDRLSHYQTKDEDINSSKVVEALRIAMQDPVEENRDMAINRVGGYGEDAINALPQLIVFAMGNNESHSERAVIAIGELGEVAAPAVPYLIANVDQPEPVNLIYALSALEKIGPAAKAAEQVLARNVSRRWNGEFYAETLGRLGLEEPLRELIISGNEEEKSNAAKGAQYLTHHSPELVAGFIRLAKQGSDGFGPRYAIEALGTVNPTTKEIVATLGELTTSRDEYTRQYAVKALGKIEPPLAEAVPFLLQAKKDDDEDVAEAATMSLARFEFGIELRIDTFVDQIILESYVSSAVEQSLEKEAAEFYPAIMQYIEDEQKESDRRAFAISLFEGVLDNEEFGTEEQKKETIAYLKGMVSFFCSSRPKKRDNRLPESAAWRRSPRRYSGPGCSMFERWPYLRRIHRRRLRSTDGGI